MANTIEDLDPTQPPNDGTGSAGQGDDEIRALKQTFQVQFEGSAGDKYDIPLQLGPRRLEEMDSDVTTVLAEVWTDPQDTGADSRIDTLENDTAKKGEDETIDGKWLFDDRVQFTGGAGKAVTVAGSEVVTEATFAQELEDNYRLRNRIAINEVTTTPYTVQDADWGARVTYRGTDSAAEIRINAGEIGDTLFVVNSGSPTTVLTVTALGGMQFRNRYGEAQASFTITGRWRNVGIVQVSATRFELSGDYD